MCGIRILEHHRKGSDAPHWARFRVGGPDGV